MSNPSPYSIWIAEVMSQQSTLKMMLPFYERWMIRFPTLEDLAQAESEAVLKLWQGLGYYSRARNLLAGAKAIAHSKDFPNQVAALLQVPGIGPYTAAAIAAIAFDQPEVPVDGNVLRVFSRLFLIPNPLNAAPDRRKIETLTLNLARTSQPGERSALAQSLMELGATVCRPGAQALCEQCPVADLCQARAADRVAELPQKKVRPSLSRHTRLLLIYRTTEGEILLRQRKVSGPLAEQWEIPYLDLGDDDEWTEQNLKLHFEVRRGFRHTIMNQVFSVWLVEAGHSASFADHQALTPEFARHATLTTTTHKALRALGL